MRRDINVDGESNSSDFTGTLPDAYLYGIGIVAMVTYRHLWRSVHVELSGRDCCAARCLACTYERLPQPTVFQPLRADTTANTAERPVDQRIAPVRGL